MIEEKLKDVIEVKRGTPISAEIFEKKTKKGDVYYFGKLKFSPGSSYYEQRIMLFKDKRSDLYFSQYDDEHTNWISKFSNRRGALDVMGKKIILLLEYTYNYINYDVIFELGECSDFDEKTPKYRLKADAEIVNLNHSEVSDYIDNIVPEEKQSNLAEKIKKILDE